MQYYREWKRELLRNPWKDLWEAEDGCCHHAEVLACMGELFSLPGPDCSS